MELHTYKHPPTWPKHCCSVVKPILTLLLSLSHTDLRRSVIERRHLALFNLKGDGTHLSSWSRSPQLPPEMPRATVEKFRRTCEAGIVAGNLLKDPWYWNSRRHLANHFINLRFSSALDWSESQSWFTQAPSKSGDAPVILSVGWDTRGKCGYWLTVLWSTGRRSI